METKVCTKCGETKPAGEGGDFGWCKDKRRPSVGYWRSCCKKCFAAENNKWNKENLEKGREHERKYREKNPQVNGTSGAIKRTPLTIEELFNGLSREEVNTELAFDYRLAKLLSEKEGEPYEIDHYPVAISNGGHHRLYNIRIVPRWVNRQGGDHSADAFGMEDNLTDEDIERLDREALEFQP